MIILKSPYGEINYFMLLIFLMVCLGQAGIIEKMLSAASDWSDKQGTESCQQKKEKHPTYAVAIPQEKIVYVPMAPKKSSPKAQVVKAQVVQAKIVKAAPAPAKMGQVVQAKVIKAESPSMVTMGKATSGKMAMGQPWESDGGGEMMEMGNQWADASEQQEQQYQQQQQQQQSDYNYEDDYVQDERMQESSSDNQQQSFEEVLDNEEIDYSFSPSDSMQFPSRSLANILHVGPNGRYKISSMMTSDVDTEWN